MLMISHFTLASDDIEQHFLGIQQYPQQQIWGMQQYPPQQAWGMQQYPQQTLEIQQYPQQQAWGMQHSGQTLYLQAACQRCHGMNGNAPNDQMSPKLAGQKMLYLINQMRAIRLGIRTNHKGATMVTHISTFNDTQIQSIASWLASIGKNDIDRHGQFPYIPRNNHNQNNINLFVNCED